MRNRRIAFRDEQWLPFEVRAGIHLLNPNHTVSTFAPCFTWDILCDHVQHQEEGR